MLCNIYLWQGRIYAQNISAVCSIFQQTMSFESFAIDLFWFGNKLCTNYCRSSLVCFFTMLSFTVSPAECLDNSCRAANCFRSAGPISNWLEACSSTMGDNVLSNQVVSIDTETFWHQQRLGYFFPFFKFVADPLDCSLALSLFTAARILILVVHFSDCTLHLFRNRISGFVLQLCCC